MNYNALEDWVPTLGRVPQTVHHGLARLRGEICKHMRSARAAGDDVTERRVCKLLTFLDRLVLCTPRSTRGGQHNGGITAHLKELMQLNKSYAPLQTCEILLTDNETDSASALDIQEDDDYTSSDRGGR